jgi:hypothetical protein
VGVRGCWDVDLTVTALVEKFGEFADSYYILAGKTREYIFHERASRQMATRKFAESRPFSSDVFCALLFLARRVEEDFGATSSFRCKLSLRRHCIGRPLLLLY